MNDMTWNLGAAELVDRIRNKVISATELLDGYLDRIERLDTRLCALGDMDIAGAKAQALDVDAGKVNGALAGIPIGVKDIIDVRGLTTSCDSPIYKDFVAARDAACVRLLRAAGGVILGKTRTTEFAYVRPTETRNPVNDMYSPGGSSSGSAAGVGAGLFPLALGTQTGGSTIRPGSYCGVYAFKPTFGLIDRLGVFPLAPSLDTIGWYGASIADLRLVLSVLAHTVKGPGRYKKTSRPPKLALCRTPYWHQADETMRSLVEESANRLGAQPIALPDSFRQVYKDHASIMAIEASRSLRFEYARHRGDLSEPLIGLIERGLAISTDEECSARNRLAKSREEMDAMLEDYDCFITPSSPGPAPKTLSTTGDSVFNRLWTALHVPCVQIPAAKNEEGMPLGLQFVGRRYNDDVLLDHAAGFVNALLI